MRTVDFVIVGAGVHGCAVAYHLAKGGSSVRLIEQNRIADGASGGDGKRGVRANRRDIRELPLMSEAYALWPTLSDELCGETGYERTGGIYLIEKEPPGINRRFLAAQARAEAQTALGIPTELWSADQVRETLPGVSAEVAAGLYTPLDGTASQAKTTHSYMKAALRHGVEILEGSPVVELSTDKASHTDGVVTADGQHHAAGRGVLLANNTGTKSLVAASLGVSLPLWNIYPQVLMLAAQNLQPLPFLVGHDSRTLSVKILEDESIMLSGGWTGRRNPENGAGEVVNDNIQKSISELQATFPRLGKLTLLDAYADRAEAICVDDIPLIGQLRNGLYMATGWSAHGWAIAPSVSQHIAEMLLDGTTNQSIAPFSPDRFGSYLAK